MYQIQVCFFLFFAPAPSFAVFVYDACYSMLKMATHICWRRGVVVSGVRRMNEVNARRARLVPGWVTVFGRIYHLDMELGQVSLAPLQGRLIEYHLRLG